MCGDGYSVCVVMGTACVCVVMVQHVCVCGDGYSMCVCVVMGTACVCVW